MMKAISTHISDLFGAALLILFGMTGMAQTAFAQAEEASDQEKAVHYSLYFEDFKNENYSSALPNLKWIIENAPGYPRNDDRNRQEVNAAPNRRSPSRCV